MTLQNTNFVWLITGASSGLGLALAEHLLMNGELVAHATELLESDQNWKSLSLSTDFGSP